jgi:hypothetical protein
VRPEKAEKIVLECYTRLFKAASPSADFGKMLENAKTNSNGEKTIPFMDHGITQKDEEAILDEIAKKYKLTKFEKSIISNTVILGCSPKYIV